MNANLANHSNRWKYSTLCSIAHCLSLFTLPTLPCAVLLLLMVKVIPSPLSLAPLAVVMVAPVLVVPTTVLYLPFLVLVPVPLLLLVLAVLVVVVPVVLLVILVVYACRAAVRASVTGVPQSSMRINTSLRSVV